MFSEVLLIQCNALVAVSKASELSFATFQVLCLAWIRSEFSEALECPPWLSYIFITPHACTGVKLSVCLSVYCPALSPQKLPNLNIQVPEPLESTTNLSKLVKNWLMHAQIRVAQSTSVTNSVLVGYHSHIHRLCPLCIMYVISAHAYDSKIDQYSLVRVGNGGRQHTSKLTDTAVARCAGGISSQSSSLNTVAVNTQPCWGAVTVINDSSYSRVQFKLISD